MDEALAGPLCDAEPVEVAEMEAVGNGLPLAVAPADALPQLLTEAEPELLEDGEAVSAPLGVAGPLEEGAADAVVEPDSDAAPEAVSVDEAAAEALVVAPALKEALLEAELLPDGVPPGGDLEAAADADSLGGGLTG